MKSLHFTIVYALRVIYVYVHNLCLHLYCGIVIWTSLPSSVFSEIPLVGWSWPWWWYVLQGEGNSTNQGSLFFIFLEIELLNIYPTTSLKACVVYTGPSSSQSPCLSLLIFEVKLFTLFLYILWFILWNALFRCLLLRSKGNTDESTSSFALPPKANK